MTTQTQRVINNTLLSPSSSSSSVHLWLWASFDSIFSPKLSVYLFFSAAARKSLVHELNECVSSRLLKLEKENRELQSSIERLKEENHLLQEQQLQSQELERENQSLSKKVGGSNLLKPSVKMIVTDKDIFKRCSNYCFFGLCLFVLVGASAGFVGSGESDQSGHGVSRGGDTEGKTESGPRTSHSKGRERQTGNV